MYATPASMVQQFGRDLFNLLDVEEGSDVSANVALLAACDRANSEVDSYLREQYALPLDAVPAVLVGFAGDLTRYHLVSSRRIDMFGEAEDRAYSKAIGYLKDLSLGRARLSLSDSEGAGMPELVRLGDAVDDGRGVNSSWFERY